ITVAGELGYVDTVALLHHRKGVTYNKMDDMEAAIAATQRAIALRIDLADTTGLGQSYYNLAYFYEWNNQARQALEAFERAVQLGDGPKNTFFFYAIIPLASRERDFGDYGRAIAHLELCLDFLATQVEDPNEDPYRFGITYLNLGSVYNVLGTKKDIEQSLIYLKQAQAFLEQLDPSNDLADCYKELGNSYDELQQHTTAIDFYEKTKGIYTADEDGEALAGSYMNIGIQYRKIGAFAKAKQNFQQGLQLLEAAYGTGYHYSKAKLADNLADTYRDQGQFETALQYYQDAIQHSLPTFRANDYLQNPSKAQLLAASDKEAILTYLGDKAQGWLAFYESTQNSTHLKEALATLALADVLIDAMRREHSAEESKLIWRRKVHDIYETALSIAFSLEDQERAFYFFEKSKSILLLDGLMAADARALISDSLAQQERALIQQIIDLNEALAEAPNDQELRTQKLASEKELQALVKQLAATNPKYHELRYTAAVQDLATTQQALRASEAMVTYFFGKRAIYAMPITAQGAQLVRIERDSLLDQTLGRLIEQFQEASAILNHPGQYASDAYALYALLLEPVLERLAVASIQSLCFVLDGPLQYLPFEALLVEPPSRYNLGLLPYLIRNYEVRYAYSATILSKQQALSTATTNAQVFGVAPFATANGALGQLPYSKTELQGIKALAKGAYYLDASASSIAFRQMAPLYRVLHLSTHASANSASAKPFIYFADQKLFLSDLYTMELPADLVVLSACETGLGKVQTGEGVMSLSRGFTYAGAKSLISSLWRVNDQSTSDIFTGFYEVLKEGKTKSSALHEAKLNYLNSTQLADAQKSPYYWAGFVYVGSDGGLELERSSEYWWWIILLGVLLVLGAGWRFRRRKRTSEPLSSPSP
ncbi:MAG: CHAT domain-containing tetratricopeptide repeat protein, partial [Bacteroidota bacterium]